MGAISTSINKIHWKSCASLILGSKNREILKTKARLAASGNYCHCMVAWLILRYVVQQLKQRHQNQTATFDALF